MTQNFNPIPQQTPALAKIHTLPQLVAFLREEMGWPISAGDFEALTFEDTPEELGVEIKNAAKIQELWHLKPLDPPQPFGIFFIKFDLKQLPLTALRTLLRALVRRKRQDRSAADRQTWDLEDLLFICGHQQENGQEAATFVHFAQAGVEGRAARLTSFGWTQDSINPTVLEFNLPPLKWPISTMHDAQWRNQWLGAFDKRKLAEVFFIEYQALFSILQAGINQQTNDAAWARDYALQFLNRCMFIFFIQCKRWLGDNPNFLRSFWTAYRSAKQPQNTFCDKWLKVMFFEAFNNSFHGGYIQFPDEIKKALQHAPYPHGGLFEENHLDRKHPFLLSDEYFLQVLTFFERYNFTASEDTPLDREVAVDAEVFGRVYERLINLSDEADERGDAGIFYTSRTEIDLMCRLALVDCMANHLGGKLKPLFYEAVFACTPDDKRNADLRLEQENLWVDLNLLFSRITMIDPACGSGSFLIGMLQVLDDLLERANRVLSRPETSYERRKRIICQSLYGMDVMRWAVEAAELRLWLQLVSESDLAPAALKFRPLPPNLFFNVRCGDSLVQELGGINIGRISEPDGISTTLKDKLAQFKGNRQGFDIVIGNPPYVRQENISDPNLSREKVTADNKKAYKHKLARLVYQTYPSFFGYRAGIGAMSPKMDAKSDLYVYFFFQGLALLNKNGSFCFITSNSWLDAGYGAGLQEFLLAHCHIKMVLDNQARRSFASAQVNTVMALISAPFEHQSSGLEKTARFIMFKAPFEQVLSPAVFQEIEEASERKTTPEYRVFPISQARLWEDGGGEINAAVEEETPAPRGRRNPIVVGPLIKVARYLGNKWGGKYLRAPDIYWTILEKGKGKLARLGELAQVRRGVTTGANEFFYLDAGRIRKWGIEEAFLRPVIVSPRACASVIVDPENLPHWGFFCGKDPAQLNGTNAWAYIKWGEQQGFHQRPSCRRRPRWYELPVRQWATVLWPMIHNDRQSVFWNSHSVVVDHNFFEILGYDHDLLWGSLAWSAQILFRELHGRANLGQGALKTEGIDIRTFYLLTKEKQTATQDFIKEARGELSKRRIETVADEAQRRDRRALDNLFFDRIGFSEGEREAVYEAVINLVAARLAKAASLEPNKRQTPLHSRSRACDRPAAPTHIYG